MNNYERSPKDSLLAMRPACLTTVFALVFVVGCGSRSNIPAPKPPDPERTDVSQIVPGDLKFAENFVRLLVDSGWTVQPVRHSKMNGFFLETQEAAWILTDKGILEVIFFENRSRVEQIQITEEASIPTYHKYVLKTPTETRRIEGALTFFTKYHNMLIVTIDAHLKESLNQVLASERARSFDTN